ncbi:MAG: hypothetical protein ABF289_14845, partial [Clostridiales bacterium]
MKTRLYKRKKLSSMFFFYMSVIIGIGLISISYGAWTNSMEAAGVINTSGVKVEFVSSNINDYTINDKKDIISIQVDELIPENKYSFDVN